MSDIQPISKRLESSSGSATDPEIDKIIDNLPKEFLEAMRNENVLLVDVNVVKKTLSKVIYDAKKEVLIKPLPTQINFKVPKSLKDSKDVTIKKDLIFYKRAYEEESANINKIINATNMLNNQLLEPLKSIKDILKKYQKDFMSNLSSIHIPYTNKKEGLDSINSLDLMYNNEEMKKQYEENVKEINEEMNSYQKEAINFCKDYSTMNQDIADDIKSFLETFNILIDSVNNLKKEMINGFEIFENCAPEFDDLNDKERIRKATKAILDPLNKITFLINESQKLLKNAEDNQNASNANKGLAQKMIEVCEELRVKATTISGKINEARLKINLNKMQFPVLDIKEPNIHVIEENINEVKTKIEETNKKNEQLKEEVMKKTDEFINQSRLDILYIIDLTNSINTYLSDIKNNFTYMINSIIDNCPTATVYTGFIGYTDFSELDLEEEYININFTKEGKEISDKIKELESHGGGDDAEDLCGAFDLALKMEWKGFSRFAILATDAPCHGNEFHNDEVTDNYPDGDRDGRDIKEKVRKLAANKISLFCAKYGETTDEMYEIFKKEYEKGKQKNSDNQFTVEKCENICEIIIKKASDIYKSRKDEPKE